MRLFVRLCRAYKATVSYEKYAGFNPSPLSLKQLLEFGTKTGSEKTSFHFLSRELPVRLANIMKEISLLPERLLHMPSVTLVMNWYEQSFRELIQFESTSAVNDKTLKEFMEIMTYIRNRHSNVVETMAQGVVELKDMYGINAGMEDRIQYFLDRFYMSRISIRMLINQHTLLFGKEPPQPSRIGCIDPDCNIRNVVEDAFENAKFLCEQYYLVAPDLDIEVINGKSCAVLSGMVTQHIAKPVVLHHISGTPHRRGIPDGCLRAYAQSLCTANTKDHTGVVMVYVPSHLYHMIFELFKNSMRATVEYYSDDQDLPAIKVVICKGEEDLCIKMSDQGGGIPRSKMDLLFRYLYSTAPLPCRSDSVSAPLAGYGYGLPLSRLYARYFHGDLMLSSLEGYGTDAYIYLKVPCEEANELLPVYNRTVSKMYASDKGAHDWSSKPKTHKHHASVTPQAGWSSDGTWPYRTMSSFTRCTPPHRSFSSLVSQNLDYSAASLLLYAGYPSETMCSAAAQGVGCADR